MDHLTSIAAAACAECRRPTEPPFTPLYDLFGGRARWVVCLDCYEDIMRSNLRPETDRYDLGGEG